MTTISSKYLGTLRTESTHDQSGTTLVTDAPKDNRGKGESFSPTDLAATALGTCIVTTMAIRANDLGVAVENMTFKTEKIMAANPRRIETIRVHIEWETPQGTEEQREKLKAAGLSCPVGLSLHPNLKQDVTFNF
ncbi:OsmC family protein [Roseivirga sp. BDSF3-8]|uniref:OsmC family protein n=1 Tax=Roseivirga sp. BDSF3-8 TaxID=3241598 RepID=UPI0035322F7A